MKARDRSDATGTLPAPRLTSWVQKTPGVCGGDACIRKTRITVWGLVERRTLGASDDEMLRDIPGLTRDDLRVAWEYYEQHREEIDQAIRENEEA
jgi:type III restriction enzyme